jgi:hypothetical protein
MSDTDLKRAANALERISLVLAGLYASQLGDADLGTKAERLNQCGFANAEIAILLGSTEGAVRVYRHHTRKGKTKAGRKKAVKTKAR